MPFSLALTDRSTVSVTSFCKVALWNKKHSLYHLMRMDWVGDVEPSPPKILQTEFYFGSWIGSVAHMYCHPGSRAQNPEADSSSNH